MAIYKLVPLFCKPNILQACYFYKYFSKYNLVYRRKLLERRYNVSIHFRENKNNQNYGLSHKTTFFSSKPFSKYFHDMIISWAHTHRNFIVLIGYLHVLILFTLFEFLCGSMVYLGLWPNPTP
jgi:hypothetical protein